MHIAVARLIPRKRTLIIIIFWISCATLRHGSEIVQHANVLAPDAFGSGIDVSDGEKLLSEVVDGVKGVGREAKILIDEGVASTQGVSIDIMSA